MRGLTPQATTTPIVPIHVGDEARCVQIATGLRAVGFHVDAIVFPAIGPGQSRLRFIMNAHHTREQIDGVTDALACLMEF
jgi:7-keto-8-aminopelargonate synthetase-like enzyme